MYLVFFGNFFTHCVYHFSTFKYPVPGFFLTANAAILVNRIDYSNSLHCRNGSLEGSRTLPVSYQAKDSILLMYLGVNLW